jgi:AraC family transcriptional regulator
MIETAAISPLAWGRSLSAPPLVTSDDHGWRTSLLRRWRGTDAHMSQPRLDHHYVVLHLGGRKTVQRRSGQIVDRYAVEEGTLTVVPKGASFEWETSGPIDFAHLYIHPARFDRAVAMVFDREPSRVTLRDAVGVRDPLLADLILAMLEEMERPSRWSPLYLDTLFDTAVIHLARRHSTLGEVDQPSRHVLAPVRLKRVLEHVDARLAEPISLADLAAVAGLSPFHFSRAFHRSVGLPPLAYVARRRVEAARELLRQTDLSLAEVAARTGFNSPGWFSTAFRRHTGLKPSLYRRQP